MFDLIGKTVGPYRIIEQIGTGGMATVYKAYQSNMDRYIAIKILPFHLSNDSEFTKRFQREARAIARLEHSHILPVYDYGESDGIPYIAMRYIKAGTLRDRMSKGSLPLEEINRLISQVGSALDYAHRMGVIHRDIKPSNVLMDDQGDTYLSDFGLARMMEPSQKLTASGVGLGTPAYMSPEQGQGVKIDHRSDIYSLGIILYEMATGHVPYEAETPMAVVLKHITDQLPLPHTINPNVPEQVERVILKALAKDPANRYQTAGEMVQALNSAIPTKNGERQQKHMTAKRVPVHEDLSLFTRLQRSWGQPRGRTMLTGGALVVILILGFLLSRLPGNITILAPAATDGNEVLPQVTSTSFSAPATPTTTATMTTVPTVSPELPDSSTNLKWEQVYDGSSFLPVALNALTVDPNDPNIIFAGTTGAGIYISRDGGETWNVSNDGLGKGTVGTIVIDPDDSNVVYAGLFDKGGLYKSTDGGHTWQASHQGIDLDTGGTWLGLIQIDPTNSQHLYYTGSDQLYQSINGGESWVQQSRDCPLVMAFAIDPTNGDHLYAAGRTGSESCPAGVYETLNAGKDWIQLTTTDMTIRGGDWWHVAADPRNFNTIYAGNWNSAYKSTDGGKTWGRIYNDGCWWLAVHPDDGTVYCGHQGQIHISHNSGTWWEDATIGPDWGAAAERFPFALVPGTQTLYAGTDAVMRSDNGGKTWNSLVSLRLPRMRLILNPNNSNQLFLGGWPGVNYDNPCNTYRSDDAGVSWHVIVAYGKGGCMVAIDSSTSTIYRSGGWEDRLYRSIDSGENWQAFQGEVPPENNMPELLPHPGKLTKLWLITEGTGFYVSKDSGVTFNSPKDVESVYQSILLIHPAGQRLYLISQYANYRSDNSGESWQPINHPGGAYLAGAIDPSNPDVLYIGSGHKGMYKSSSGGRSWSSLANLQATSINDIVIDPNNTHIVYAATNKGAFVSKNGGENWTRIQEGLGPNPIVYSIAIDPNDSSKVYAVTPDGIFRSHETNETLSTSTETTCPPLDVSQRQVHSKPAILFDEAHDNGLSLTEEGARQIDLRPELYFYAGDLADYFRQNGYLLDSTNSEAFSATDLSNYDLLIISGGISHPKFNSCEIEAVMSFVENGGGLLILGDGSFNKGINALLNPFGIAMSRSLVVHTEIDNLPENFWVTDFPGHPATSGVTHAWFNWGTSIEILDNSWSVLMNSPKETWLDKNVNFVMDTNESNGPFILGAAREYIDGRVIVYGDNNVWDYYRDSNYPMFLSMIRWATGDPARAIP